MKKLFLTLLALCCATQTSCSTKQPLSFLDLPGDVLRHVLKFAGEDRSLLPAMLDSNYKKAELLIELGADVNIKNVYGETASHLAAERNADNVIELLLDAGARINQQDNQGWTPLHYAAYFDAYKVIPLLIKAGADTTIQNRKNDTPRIFATKSQTLTIFDQAVKTRQRKQKSAMKRQALGRSKKK